MAEPRIRFIEGSETSFPEWSMIPLHNILSEYKEFCEKDGTYEHVSLTKEGVVPKSERYERDFLVTTEDKKYRITHYNDICYNPANLKFGVICRNKYGNAIFSPIYVTFKVAKGFLPEFIELLVTDSSFIQRALRFQQGTVYERMAVSPEDLLSMIVRVPCLEEQHKIADFLISVDEVITVSEEEVANLETQKKAVMKKIFSQEVRFGRADGSDFPEWEEQTLGNLAEFSKGQGYTKSDLSETGSPIILYGRLYTKYRTVISEVDTFAEIKPRSVFSKKGDVIVPASGETAEDISVAAVVDVDGIILGGDLNIIHPCGAILPDYLAYALTFGTPHQEMAKRAQGKSIVHLHNDDLKSAVIVYPCLEEQRLIANFLSDFDEAIASAKKELELWKELKKGLLQQMFV